MSEVLTGTSSDDVLIADGTEKKVTGGDGNDTIYGSEIYDWLLGGDGNDIIYSNGGSDLVYGNLGYDKLVLPDNVLNYTFTATNDGWKVTHKKTGDTVTFKHIEEVIFDAGNADWGTEHTAYNIVIGGGNNTPYAENLSLTLNEDTSTSFDLSHIVWDFESALSFIAQEITTATGGRVSINANGQMTYTARENYNGPDSFSYTVTDGTHQVTRTVSLDVDPVNDAPVNTVSTAQATNEDTAFLFSSANGNALSVSDSTDTSEGSSTDWLSSTVSVLHGTLTVASGSGATASGDGSASVTISGTAAQINAALNGLRYAPTANYNGADTLTITTNDGGYNNNDAGGVNVLSDTDTVAITVHAVNDTPVNSVSGAQTTNEDTALFFSSANGNALSVSDSTDTSEASSTDWLSTTLNVQHGTLTVASGSGATVSGDGSASVTISGTAAQINAALNGLGYAPAANYSGADTLTMATNDGGFNNHDAGGINVLSDTDTVAITVTPDADTPTLSYTLQSGGSINEIVIKINTALTDNDGSESLSLTFAGLAGKAGVQLFGSQGNALSLNGDGNAVLSNVSNGETQVTLRLPQGSDWSFPLQITAQSREGSNGDTASTSQTLQVEYDASQASKSGTFTIGNVNMWGGGGEWVFQDNDFYGIEFSESGTVYSVVFYDVALKAGLATDIYISGGNIDASLPYLASFNSYYNTTLNTLLIDTGGELASGGGFTTVSPYGHFDLDLIFNGHAIAGISVPGIKILGKTFGGYDWRPLDYSFNEDKDLLYVDSSFEQTFSPFPATTVTLSFPNITTSSIQTGTGYSSSGSDTFLNVNLDIDELVTYFTGIPFSASAPFDLTLFKGYVSLTAIDADIFGDFYVTQNFSLTPGQITGTLDFTETSTQENIAFTLGSDLSFSEASQYDVNKDGVIGVLATFDLANALFRNDTDLKGDLGYNLDILSVYIDIDRVSGGSLIPLKLTYSDFATVSATLYDGGGQVNVATVGIYDETFAADFASQQVSFTA